MAFTLSLHRSSHRLIWPVVAGSGAALGLLAAEPGSRGPTVCPIALVTGVACPGCGMTRAMVALVHGDLGAAWSFHPLFGLIAAEVIVAFVWWLGYRSGLTRRLPSVVEAGIVGVTGVALLAVWALRLSQGTLPPV